MTVYVKYNCDIMNRPLLPAFGDSLGAFTIMSFIL